MNTYSTIFPLLLRNLAELCVKDILCNWNLEQVWEGEKRAFLTEVRESARRALVRLRKPFQEGLGTGSAVGGPAD